MLQIMASATEDLSTENQFSPEPETGKIPHGVRADASPDAKCPICLDRFDNMSYIDRCFHKFCFRCIQEWSRNKAECPLCKQPFNSIFHSVRTENDFQEYVLKATENGSFASPGGQRFRYRTTLTRERRTSRQLRRSPVFPVVPDNGVVFETLGRQPRAHQRPNLHRMMLRLGARRRAQSEGRSTRQVQEQEMINFRRELYRSGLRVRNIQDGGRYRDISAEFFRRNAACLHRLMPWLKRELCVLFGSHGSVVNIVQHIIMSNIVRYDMDGQAFQDELRPFLLSRTEHFLHEFTSFARAPFNMESYDQRANYDCPAPSYEDESDSDLSVITISPDTANIRGEDRSIPNPSELPLGLSQTTWDDETPGPSYSVAETMESVNSSPGETSAVSEETPPQVGSSLLAVSIKSDPGTKEDKPARSVDDCLIVGYMKPLAERTPELIELSSDSEVSVQATSTEVVQQPTHLRFNSTSSLSSSTRSSSVRSSVSRERLKRKQLKQKKSNKSKRDKRHSHKNSHSRGSVSCSSRHGERMSSRGRGSSKDRSRVRSPSRDKYDLRRTERSSTRDRAMVAYSYSRGEHQAKNRSRRAGRDRSSSRERASGKDIVTIVERAMAMILQIETELTTGEDHRVRIIEFDLVLKVRASEAQVATGMMFITSTEVIDQEVRPVPDLEQPLEGSSPGPLSQCSSNSKSGSVLLESTLGNDPKVKKHKEKKRSVSVEIVYEGKVTEASRHHKRKRKHKKKQKREKSSERADSECHSPLVITIESDSDVIVTSMEDGNSTVNTTTNLLNEHFELVEKCVLETLEPQELPDTTPNIFIRHTSTESLDVCGLSADSDPSPPNPNEQTLLDQEDVSPVTDADYPQNFIGEERDHGQHCSSPSSTLPKSSSGRPPLILKIPKRFINGANLFSRPTENA
ncbi:hypothetical protein scyTo_0004435 [Scyliorhinus torazame]|uniref:E3 ubiquitin-protein ligase Topors n=1 Tax=Scyliorhinus torazame TaxID=75743 RepID=A0A401NRP8_SCYTO|nr:hypothetical protein [Scyliorhinus torazame]